MKSSRKDRWNLQFTSTHLFSRGRTYVLSEMLSSSLSVQPPYREGPIAFGLLGLVCLMTKLPLGLLLCVIAMIWWSRQQLRYSVMIQTADGYTTVWQHSDFHRAFGMVKLLNSRRRLQGQPSDRSESTEKRQLGNAD